MLPASLTLATVTALLPDADRLAASGALNLSGVKNCDSAGLAFLLELRRRARRAGRDLRLTEASPAIQRLASFFELEPLLLQ